MILCRYSPCLLRYISTPRIATLHTTATRSMSRPDDPRLGDIVKDGHAGEVVLLGHPVDEGC